MSATFENQFISPVGDKEGCQYHDGNCNLNDNNMINRTPNPQQRSQFVKVQRWLGHMFGNVWLSASKEFALSFTEALKRITNCKRELVISDQEYAVKHFE